MNIIIYDIWRRVNKLNRNYICCFVGGTGSGKSWSAISLAKTLDPTFNLDRIVFTPEQFLNLLNTTTLPKGAVIIWEEGGVSYSARDFWSISNKLIGYVLQSFRYQNLILIFTLPSLKFLDVIARRLMHGYFETQTIHYKEGLCSCKHFRMQPNAKTGDVYYKYPRVKGVEGTKVITRLEFRKPPDDFIKSYEDKKYLECEKLKTEAEKEILTINEVKLQKGADVGAMIEDAKTRKADFMTEYNQRKFYDLNKIMDAYKVGQLRAKNIRTALEKV